MLLATSEKINHQSTLVIKWICCLPVCLYVLKANYPNSNKPLFNYNNQKNKQRTYKHTYLFIPWAHRQTKETTNSLVRQLSWDWITTCSKSLSFQRVQWALKLSTTKHSKSSAWITMRLKAKLMCRLSSQRLRKNKKNSWKQQSSKSSRNQAILSWKLPWGSHMISFLISKRLLCWVSARELVTVSYFRRSLDWLTTTSRKWKQTYQLRTVRTTKSMCFLLNRGVTTKLFIV